MKTSKLVQALILCSFSGMVSAQAVESDVTVATPVGGTEPVIIKREAGVRHFNLPVAPAPAHNMMFISSGLMPGRLFPPDMIMRNLERLALTDRQIKAIKDEMRTFQSGMVDVQWSLHEAQAGLDKELSQERIDEDKTLERMDAVMGAENSLKKSHLALLIRIRNLLDKNQLAELEKLPGFFGGGIGIAAPPISYPAMEWRGIEQP